MSQSTGVARVLVDIGARRSTVTAMTLLLIVAVLLVTIAAILLVRRGRRFESVAITRGEDSAPESDTSSNTGGPGVPAPATPRVGGKVGAVAQAYQDGDIDDELLSKAARRIGISEDEARRRLGAAASGQVTDTRATLTAQQRAARKKKNKQSKQARKANRH